MSAIGVQTIGSYGLLTFKTEVLDASELNACFMFWWSWRFLPHAHIETHQFSVFFILWPFDPSTKLQRVTRRRLHKDTRLMWPWLPQIKTDFIVIHFHRLSCRTLIFAQSSQSALSFSFFVFRSPDRKSSKRQKKKIDLSHRLEKILRTCLLIPAFIFLSPLFIPLLVFWPWQITQPAFISPSLLLTCSLYKLLTPPGLHPNVTHTHTQVLPRSLCTLRFNSQQKRQTWKLMDLPLKCRPQFACPVRRALMNKFIALSTHSTISPRSLKMSTSGLMAFFRALCL